MKINMPVTNNEILFDDAQFMLTKTDLKGTITFANQDFIKVSGFSEAELVGQSHNMVRHPDMPVEAFEDMWRSLKDGRPWTGLVKNRTKNGDFYWVQANAAPVFEGNVAVGYLSVRRKPTRQQVEAADSAYRLFKEGKAQGLSIVDGKVVKNSTLNKLNAKLQNINVSKRILAIIGLALAVTVTQAGIGLYELTNANKTLESVYKDRLIPIGQLDIIGKDLLKNRAHLNATLASAQIGIGANKTPILTLDAKNSLEEAQYIEAKIEEVNKTWSDYLSTALTPEEKVLADNFAASRGRFVSEILKPALVQLRANNYAELKKISLNMRALFNAADKDLEALMQLQESEAAKAESAAVAHYANVRLLTLGGLLGAVALLLWLGLAISRSITKPLGKSIAAFGQISRAITQPPLRRKVAMK